MVTDVDADGIEIKDADGQVRRINAATKIWAAGVQASPLARLLGEQSGAEVDRAGRVAVLPDLTLPGHPEVHVVGDMMALDKLPGVAQVAIQGGRYAADQIKRRIAGKAPREPFKYHDKGSMATISRFHAVVDLGKLKFEGFIAWLMWLALHLFYIVGFKSRVTTVLHWLVSFMGRGRSQRVATQQQVYGRLALEHLGPDFEASKTGGLHDAPLRRPDGHRARVRLTVRSAPGTPSATMRAATSRRSPVRSQICRCRDADVPRLKSRATSSSTSAHSSCARRSSSSSASRRRTASRASTGAPSDRVEQLAADAVPGGPPARRPEELRPRLRARLAPLGPGGQHAHQRPHEGGVQHGVVHVRADVGEPELQRREVVGRPDVPVEVRPVADDARGDHPGDDLLEPLGAAQVLGRPGVRPAAPPQRAVALVPGVDAVVERRAAGHRQQHRQIGPRPVHHGDRGLQVGHPDVHVAAADVLLGGQARPARRRSPRSAARA